MNLVLRFPELESGEAVDESDFAGHIQPSEREKAFPESHESDVSGARGQVARRILRTDPSSGSRIRTTSIPFRCAIREGVTRVEECLEGNSLKRSWAGEASSSLGTLPSGNGAPAVRRFMLAQGRSSAKGSESIRSTNSMQMMPVLRSCAKSKDVSV